MPPVSFTVNGKPARISARAGRTLMQALRADLGLPLLSSHPCAAGNCGGCTVLVDGKAVRACATPLTRVAGARVLTPGRPPGGPVRAR